MRTVLIVDDDEDLRLVLEEFVAVLSGGTAVLAASLDEVRRRREDALASSLAIVDINLGPDEPTGVEVVTWLKSQGYRGSIVFLTGHARRRPGGRHCRQGDEHSPLREAAQLDGARSAPHRSSGSRMTLLLASLVGAFVATGVLHAGLGLRRPLALLHLSFATMMVGFSVFVLRQLQVYRSQSVEHGIELIRDQGDAAILFFFAFAWFVRESGWRIRAGWAVAYLSILAAGLAYNEMSPYGIYLADRPALMRTEWLGEEISTFVVVPGYLQLAWFAFELASFGIGAIAGLLLVRRGDKRSGFSLMAGALMLFAGLAMDFIHELVGGTWPFLTEFALVTFSLLMSVELAIGVREQESELTRLATAALVVRDKLNTPLQTLEVGHDLLARGASVGTLVPRLQRATAQLAQLGSMLRLRKAPAYETP